MTMRGVLSGDQRTSKRTRAHKAIMESGWDSQGCWLCLGSLASGLSPHLTHWSLVSGRAALGPTVWFHCCLFVGKPGLHPVLVWKENLERKRCSILTSKIMLQVYRILLLLPGLERWTLQGHFRSPSAKCSLSHSWTYYYRKDLSYGGEAMNIVISRIVIRPWPKNEI